MSKIKSFKEFINEFEIEGEYQQGKPLWNGKDYLDEEGDIDLSNMNLTELPCVFPEVWDEGFFCNDNKLTSLEGAPKIAKRNFFCSNNQLTSLEGAPKEVGGSFACRNNPIKFSKEDVQKVSKVRENIHV